MMEKGSSIKKIYLEHTQIVQYTYKHLLEKRDTHRSWIQTFEFDLIG